MTTVLTQTQIALQQALKERDELRNYTAVQREVIKGKDALSTHLYAQIEQWRKLYNDLAEPLENAARFCAVLPPKSIAEPRLKRPNYEYAIFPPMDFSRPEAHEFATHHVERIHWIQAMIYKDEFQKLQHYRLYFDEGEQLAYQFTGDSLYIQSKEFLIREIAHKFGNLWHKEIHDAR